jgi:antitoxin component YwqK of YwqJK toxin-antitoxin module
MRFFFLASLGLLAAASACTTAVPGRRHAAFWRTNGYDRQGEQQGRWRTFFDEKHKQTRFTTGRYRHGRPVGHWRYYTQLGTLDHEERYHRDYSDITFYHPNGQVSQRGRARVVDEGTNLHYYWFGEWRRFSDTGRLVQIDTYEKGKQVASHPIQDM